MTEIYSCLMTQNRLTETIQCIERNLPYVDHMIVTDNGSVDDTIITLRNWEREEPKLHFYLHQWVENFSESRNNYLRRVPNDAWALVQDPDEQFEVKTLQSLRALITEADKRGKDMVGFQCRSVSLRGPKRVWEHMDNYWKRLFFKKYPRVEYDGNPHEHLKNHPHQIMDTTLIYEHIKQENVIWQRGFRNYVVGGGGPNLGQRNPYWTKLKGIMGTLGIQGWHDFEKYLLRGNIDQRLKNEFRSYIDLQEIFPGQTDGLSEMREAYKTYYRVWHPEEEAPDLKSRHIP